MAEPKLRRRKPGWKLPTKTCPVCFSEFKRKKKGKDAGLCCSRSCGFTLIRWRGEQRRRFRQAKAEFARWARLSRPKPQPTPKPQRQCQCGQVLSKAKRRCSRCAEIRRLEVKRNSASRRADKAYRKALSRGLIAGSEKFDPLEVLARDGWRCHICGLATPKRLRGTFHDQAPELDHVIPLALGGEHTKQNTACACRKCNAAKGAQPLRQSILAA